MQDYQLPACGNFARAGVLQKMIINNRSKAGRSNTPETPAIDFPVVAIGASAGGLDPIVAFLTQVPPDSGIAYVVIQHLDPTHKAMLPELLQRTTSIPVSEIAHHMPVRPGQIYVIPPNADLGLAKGRFQLSAPQQARGHRLPIDTFFEEIGRAHV